MGAIIPGFSANIDVRRFERRSRRLLGAGYLFAAAVLTLLALTWHSPLRVVRIADKPDYIMHSDIIERPAKPVDAPYLLPAHRPMRKQLRREDTGASLPVPGSVATRLPYGSGETYALPREMERETPSSPIPETRLEPSFPKLPEIETRIERKLKRHFSLEEEGITLNDIDSLWTYKGFLIQDPTDKRKVKGFFYIPRAVHGIPDLYARSENGILHRQYNLDSAFLGLAEAVNHFTNIEEKLELPISLSSPDLLRYPIIYLTSDSDYTFEISRSQIHNLGEYLHKGGFLIVDNGSPWYEYSPAKASLLNILLQAAGKEGRFEPITADHPIFYCFFDLSGKLPDGEAHTVAPLKERHLYTSQTELPPNLFGRLLHIPELEDLRLRISTRTDSLWGLWFGERLAAVYLDKGYGHTWRDGLYSYQYRNKRPTLELGVNIVVFALIQRGGNAQQYFDYTAEGRVQQAKNEKKEKQQ